jgi:hypothetical protein
MISSKVRISKAFVLKQDVVSLNRKLCLYITLAAVRWRLVRYFPKPRRSDHHPNDTSPGAKNPLEGFWAQGPLAKAIQLWGRRKVGHSPSKLSAVTLSFFSARTGSPCATAVHSTNFLIIPWLSRPSYASQGGCE